MTDAETETSGERGHVAQLVRYIYGNWQTCVVHAFAELGVADVIGDAAKTVDQIAESTGTDPERLLRFLRCAAGLELVAGDGDGGYALSPMGRLLLSDHPYSHRAAARLNGAPYRYQPWGRLVELLRFGDGAALSPTYRDGSLAFLDDHPQWAEVFHRAMTDLSAVEDDATVAAYDFGRFRRVVDVGCGRGTFLKRILRAHTHLRGVMFDLESALGEREPDEDDLEGRLEARPGDFFDAVPAGGDLYVLKNVIHNWPVDKEERLLRNVRTAMATPGEGAAQRRLLVIEHVIRPGDAHDVARWLDLNFMILVDGRERTLAEYRDLAGATGFEVVRVIPTPGGRQIMEWRPAEA
jgi:SAM-dependent methyltransferase